MEINKIERNELEDINVVGDDEQTLERGVFVANNYIFDIQSVRFEEEREYFSDVPLSIHLLNKKEEPQQDLARIMATLFQIDSEEEIKASLGKFGKLKLWLVKHFRRNYKYYSDSPSATGLIKWLERKVRYKNKRIRFYDLERKFRLTKKEIADMFLYLHNLSF